MCANCDAAKHYPRHPVFCPSCIWCGGRYIHMLGTLPISKILIRDRRRHVLATWIAHGHLECQLRRLALHGPSLAPDPSEPTTSTKARSRSPRR